MMRSICDDVALRPETRVAKGVRDYFPVSGEAIGVFYGLGAPRCRSQQRGLVHCPLRECELLLD